ncbi:hypothetical protein Tco_1377295 [Tanacetum coccineum]
MDMTRIYIKGMNFQAQIITTDNASSDKDTIQESQSPNSKGKYVPVCQKHNSKVKSPIPITGCVLGLANVHTRDDILKKFDVRKVESGAAKGKGKKNYEMEPGHDVVKVDSILGSLTWTYAKEAMQRMHGKPHISQTAKHVNILITMVF